MVYDKALNKRLTVGIGRHTSPLGTVFYLTRRQLEEGLGHLTFIKLRADTLDCGIASIITFAIDTLTCGSTPFVKL